MGHRPCALRDRTSKKHLFLINSGAVQSSLWALTCAPSSCPTAAVRLRGSRDAPRAWRSPSHVGSWHGCGGWDVPFFCHRREDTQGRCGIDSLVLCTDRGIFFRSLSIGSSFLCNSASWFFIRVFGVRHFSLGYPQTLPSFLSPPSSPGDSVCMCALPGAVGLHYSCPALRSR